MGGIFGGSGAGAGQLPAMSGFDANAVAQALGAVGNNAPTGMRTGVPQGAMVNPLAQMLAQQGPAYQPGDTTWGQAGDRLLRYTPQEGNVRGGTPGTGGAGGLPPINAGEDSAAYMTRIGMSPADIAAALAMSKANPGMSFQDIVAKGGYRIPGQAGGPGALPGSTTAPGGPVSIDWSRLGAKLDDRGVPVPVPPTADPPGAPAINAAMLKLMKPGGGNSIPYADRVTEAQLTQYRNAADAARAKPADFDSYSKAQKLAWYENWKTLNDAYVEADKRTGYGPGGYVLT